MKFGRFKPWNELKNNIDGTEHYEFHFKNGYGASVIRGPYSYGGPQGLYELAVLKRNRLYPRYWDVTCDTPITSDVLGNLEYNDVVKYLEEINRI